MYKEKEEEEEESTQEGDDVGRTVWDSKTVFKGQVIDLPGLRRTVNKQSVSLENISFFAVYKEEKEEEETRKQDDDAKQTGLLHLPFCLDIQTILITFLSAFVFVK